jgi:hypothetical protein
MENLTVTVTRWTACAWDRLKIEVGEPARGAAIAGMM